MCRNCCIRLKIIVRSRFDVLYVVMTEGYNVNKGRQIEEQANTNHKQ